MIDDISSANNAKVFSRSMDSAGPDACSCGCACWCFCICWPGQHANMEADRGWSNYDNLAYQTFYVGLTG